MEKEEGDYIFYVEDSNIIRSVMNNDIEDLEYYINKGEDVNDQNKNMLCGVLVAVSHGFIDCLNILLKNKADLTLVDINGENALDYSCRNRYRCSLITNKIDCNNEKYNDIQKKETSNTQTDNLVHLLKNCFYIQQINHIKCKKDQMAAISMECYSIHKI